METIQLTPEHTLFPPRAPEWSLFGWWTLLSAIVIGGVFWYRWIQKNKHGVIEHVVIPNTQYTLQQRHDELKIINTSIRTPKQKAQAILRHCFAYLGIDHEESVAPALTIQELSQISSAKPLLETCKTLYVTIYTDRELTHAHINTLVSDLLVATSGS